MKRIELTFDYPVSAEELYRLFTDEDFLRAQLESAGGSDVAVLEREVTDDAARVVWQQRTKVEVPGFAKSIVPATSKVTETDIWRAQTDGYTGEWSAETSAPAVTAGTMRIEPAPGGCRYTFVGTVKMKVPLIGGKLEGHAVQTMESDIKRKHDYTRQRVAR